MFEGKCFKWGYFTDVKDFKNDRLKLKQSNESISIMWCSRFIDWKHPELAVELAQKLKVDGYNFQLDMYGDGKMKSTIHKLIDTFELEDYVSLQGSVPNEQIRHTMAKSRYILNYF